MKTSQLDFGLLSAIFVLRSCSQDRRSRSVELIVTILLFRKHPLADHLLDHVVRALSLIEPLLRLFKLLVEPHNLLLFCSFNLLS